MILSVLAGPFALCQSSPSQEIPHWALKSRAFLSATYTLEELSIVCLERYVPPDVVSDRGWVALKANGPLELTLTGVLASLAAPLAKAGIPIFSISTFNTDYLLIKQERLQEARKALEMHGHRFE